MHLEDRHWGKSMSARLIYAERKTARALTKLAILTLCEKPVDGEFVIWTESTFTWTKSRPDVHMQPVSKRKPAYED